MSEVDLSAFQEELGHRGWYPDPDFVPHSSFGLIRIIGVLMSDPKPLWNVYLPLGPGVCALYGPNGVGKTKVLLGLSAAISGEAPSTEVHQLRSKFGRLSELLVQIGHDDRTDRRLRNAHEHPLTEALMSDLRMGARDYPEDFDLADDDDLASGVSLLEELESDPAEQSIERLLDVKDPRHAVQLRLRINMDYADGVDPIGMKKAFAKEIAQAGCFALSAKGRSDGPKKEAKVVLCIDERSASPALRDLIAGTYKELERMLAAGADTRDGGWDDYPEPFRDEDATLLPLPVLSNEAVSKVNLLAERERPAWAPFRYMELGHNVVGMAPSLQTLWVGEEVEYYGDALSSNVNDVYELVRRLAGAGEFRGDEPLYVEGRVAKIFEDANQFFETLLGRSISLRLHLGEIADLIAGHTPQILARDQSSGSWTRLERMSATEQRWAKVAIYLAWYLGAVRSRNEKGNHHAKNRLDVVVDGNLILLVDEPELGLPLAVQRQLSRGLVEISKALAIPVVVATHSSALLDDLSVSTYRCGRNESGEVALTEVQRTDRDALRTLGVPISEELHLYRTVLVVEGQHEAVVLDEMFSDTIAANRIKLLPIRGTRQLRLLAASGELLFDYLDAPFVLLTDKTRGHVVEQARSAASKATTLEEAKKAITEVLQPRSDEESVLLSLLMAAEESGCADKIKAVHGFEKDDIIHYLPCDHFVPGSTWDELVNLHKQRGDNEPKDFKRWLELTQSVDLSDENLRSAVRQMDDIPSEWTQVMSQCVDIASEWA